MEQTRSPSWTEVAELVQRAQEGDRDAFGRLVEQFQPTVYAIAQRRLGNASEAVELTQDVFLHILRRIRQLAAPGGRADGDQPGHPEGCSLDRRHRRPGRGLRARPSAG